MIRSPSIRGIRARSVREIRAVFGLPVFHFRPRSATDHGAVKSGSMCDRVDHLLTGVEMVCCNIPA